MSSSKRKRGAETAAEDCDDGTDKSNTGNSFFDIYGPEVKHLLYDLID
jgi:RNA exonuclease 1